MRCRDLRESPAEVVTRVRAVGAISCRSADRTALRNFSRRHYLGWRASSWHEAPSLILTSWRGRADELVNSASQSAKSLPRGQGRSRLVGARWAIQPREASAHPHNANRKTWCRSSGFEVNHGRALLFFPEANPRVVLAVIVSDLRSDRHPRVEQSARRNRQHRSETAVSPHGELLRGASRFRCPNSQEAVRSSSQGSAAHGRRTVMFIYSTSLLKMAISRALAMLMDMPRSRAAGAPTSSLQNSGAVKQAMIIANPAQSTDPYRSCRLDR